ncbi:hypothetical protein WJX81_002687 [Elliptochloris bilobata]|uniref:Uncharacterized protein n=1 Tax=Elliptochloris bilobata TaxID=381761 RepID=A0AAW1QJZ4_9CHLO
MTVSALAGGDVLAPALLATGHECGAVAVRPLAVAAVLHAAARLAPGEQPRSRVLGRCGARVTCLLAAAWEGVPVAVLAGSKDGAVAAWRLRPLGEPLFRLPLHAGPVRLLAAAPPELGELAASAGDDGAVCLLALPAGACARALPGPPGRAPTRLAWAPALGYLAALYAGAGSGGASCDAVGLVWDLHSGARDRVVTGAAAHALVANFAALHGGGSFAGALGGRPAYALLREDPAYVAARLLGAVSAARALMGRPPATEARCTGCAAAAALYAVGLRGALPALAPPRLDAFVACWQAPSEALREAARALMAAATDPRACSTPGQRGTRAYRQLLLAGVHSACETRWPSSEDWPIKQLAVAAAACVLHPTLVPEELIAAVVPAWAAAACGKGLAAGGSQQALAAALLAEGLAGPLGVRALPHLGSLPSLTQRVSAACGRLGAASSAQGGVASPLAAPHGPESPSHRKASSAANGRGSAASAGTSNAGGRQQQAAVAHALARLLPALAGLDLPCFLHLLGHRLAAGGTAEGHGLQPCLMALVALMQAHAGRAALAAHLPLLAAVAVKALDPAHPARRRALVQGAMVAIRELCARFPMAALHARPMQLAVGCAPGPAYPAGKHQGAPAPAAGGSRAVGELVAVYDLETGVKRRALQTRADNFIGERRTEEGVAALAFSVRGDRIAALTPSPPTLSVWALTAGWSERLQRGPAVLLPSQVVAVSERLLRPAAGGAPDLSWSLSWASETSVAVGHGGQALLVSVE